MNNLLLLSFMVYMVGVIAILILPKNMSAKVTGISGFFGSLILLFFALYALFNKTVYTVSLWVIPNIGHLSIRVDYLSAFFLIVTAIVALPASIFASTRVSYIKENNPKFLLSLFLSLIVSVILVIISSNIFLFLLAWEVMSIFIYLLINSGNNEKASYIMLAVGEAGTLAISISFLLLAINAKTFNFSGFVTNISNLSIGMQWSIFILSFLGFGIKGGLIPFNFWISRAYSITPSAFIPFIAGATLNLGLYGIIRVNAYFLPMSEIGFGIIMLITGSITALIGILYATIEDNIKTILANSSIENAGIIIAAFGASMIFLVSGHKVAAAMALVASLYHLLNHSVFKTLLFMGAGAIEDEVKTTSLDKLGGLLKRMPWTGFFILIGTLSISAMPPFNGFVSEWLTLESLLRSVELATIGVKISFIIAGILLALTAGLAVTCFTRAFSMSFLGMARTKIIEKTKEVTKTTLTSMAILSVLAFLLGVLPTFVIPTIDRAIYPITSTSATTALVPPFFNNKKVADKLPSAFIHDFHNIGAQVGKNILQGRGMVVMHRGGKNNPVIFAMSTSYMLITFLILFGLVFVSVWFLVGRKRSVVYKIRWDGGVKNLLPQMTYTASGFAQPVRVIFNAILRPNISNQKETVSNHFRLKIKQERQEIHLIDRLVLYPLIKFAKRLSQLLAKMHSGKINTYATYAILTLIVFLCISFYI